MWHASGALVGSKWVRSNGGSGVVGVVSKGRPEAGAEGEQEVEAEGEWEAEAGGVSLTITPPLDEHRLDAEKNAIGRKGIEPKARAQM